MHNLPKRCHVFFLPYFEQNAVSSSLSASCPTNGVAMPSAIYKTKVLINYN